ncbi:MAG: hypothetical protein M3Y53_06205, partial [Thermoproteota archaeon]|nr:hypothetical protein [Thermoproteota archaeon]
QESSPGSHESIPYHSSVLLMCKVFNNMTLIIRTSAVITYRLLLVSKSNKNYILLERGERTCNKFLVRPLTRQ